MKFILMMHAPANAPADAGIASWKPEEVQKMIQFMKDLNADLSAKGELASAEGFFSKRYHFLRQRLARQADDVDPPVRVRRRRQGDLLEYCRSHGHGLYIGGLRARVSCDIHFILS